MDEVTFRRARHVIRENDAVARVAEALTRGHVRKAGGLINQSYESLRHDFEESTPALDAMVDTGTSSDACYGVRLTGAGFGGASVALIDGRNTDTFVEITLALYISSIGLPRRAIAVRAMPGTSCEQMSAR